MKTKLIVIVCCIALLTSNALQAQSFGTQLKNKVVNKLENKANEKIDKSINSAVDKPVDNTEEKVKESVKSDNSTKSTSSTSTSNTKPAGDPTNGNGDLSGFMNMMSSEVKIADYPDLANVTPSAFIGSFDMIIENYKKNGSKGDDAKISWYIDKYDMIMIPEMEGNGANSSKVIINRKKGIMVILTTSGANKMGMVMKMSDLGEMVDNSDLINDELSDTKVQVFKNETQVIEGKTCYKVLVTDEEFETESWITENIALKIDQLFGYMNMQSKDQNKYEEKFGNIQGWAMKSTSIDKKTLEKTIVLTKNVKQGPLPAGMNSTEGFQLMEMPDMSNFMNNEK